MIIKKLKLENIRSYKDQVVEFPRGKTLFEGDIGSGKSTILMAIEFAFFGLGSEKPGSLLKAGENEGSVSIIFQSDGKEYTIQRHLIKKRNSFLQGDCALGIGGEVSHYSASEIKEKVLEILDFNEPADPKAQSVIFRYAIYTPQEEIKSVLALKPDLRLQTLRKAFRLEDYKVTIENTKNLHSEVKSKARDYERDAAEIPKIKEKMDQLKLWTEEKSRSLVLAQNKQGEIDSLLRDLKRKREELEKEQLSLMSETGRIQDLNSQIRTSEKEITSATKQIQSIELKMTTIASRIGEARTMENPSNEVVEVLQRELGSFKDKERVLRDKETTIRSKLQDYDSILKERVCPTCDQEIVADSFAEKLKHKQEELREAAGKVTECTSKIEHLEKVLESKRSYEQAQAHMNELLRNQTEYLEALENYKSRLQAAKESFVGSSKALAKVTESTQKLSKTEAALGQLKNEIENRDKESKVVSSEIDQGFAQMREWRREKDEHEITLKKKEEAKLTADRLNEHVIWVQDYFAPTVEAIERQVLMSINQEFDSQFQKWFSMLVEDPGKQAKIDEDFTPIIQQDGIDQDVSFLSGGEKTSVALAYRLSLNNIVRKVSLGMQSNMLILDEPTDGFSKEQLGRVREILDELECPQMILVSHEKELESFADQIFRVTKSNGVSAILAD